MSFPFFGWAVLQGIGCAARDIEPLRQKIRAMPWINKEMCTGCEVCIEECPVGAIFMEADVAVIDDAECIRCATCHDICDNDAVRHDGELIPEEVAVNLAWVRQLLAHDYYSGDPEGQQALLQRLERYFSKNKKVAEKTIERIQELMKA